MATSADICSCVAASMWWAEARNAAPHPARHRRAPLPKRLLQPQMSGVLRARSLPPVRVVPERFGEVSDRRGRVPVPRPRAATAGVVSRCSVGWETWWRNRQANMSPSMNVGPLPTRGLWDYSGHWLTLIPSFAPRPWGQGARSGVARQSHSSLHCL